MTLTPIGQYMNLKCLSAVSDDIIGNYNLNNNVLVSFNNADIVLIHKPA